jgi:hypothetical protein
MVPNLGFIHHLYSLEGYESIKLNNYISFYGFLISEKIELFSLVGVKYIISHKKIEIANFEPILEIK